MWKKYLQFVTIIITIISSNYDYSWHLDSILCAAEKIQYIATEHPRVTFFDTRYFLYLNLTSKRYGRLNPLYYVNLNLHTVATWQNNVSIDFYFHEFLTNVYKPSFIEMHFEFCHMLQHDRFFGAPLQRGGFNKPCPYPPVSIKTGQGIYHLYNMSIDVEVIPRGFPFRKGRIYCNLTSRDTKDLMASGYIDMELKEINAKKFKKGLI